MWTVSSTCNRCLTTTTPLGRPASLDTHYPEAPCPQHPLSHLHIHPILAVPHLSCPHQGDIFLLLSRGHWPPGCAGLQLLMRFLLPWLLQLPPPPVPVVYILDVGWGTQWGSLQMQQPWDGISFPLPSSWPSTHPYTPAPWHTPICILKRQSIWRKRNSEIYTLYLTNGGIEKNKTIPLTLIYYSAHKKELITFHVRTNLDLEWGINF